MKLTTIIDEIKALCPTFENRVAGAAEYQDLRNVSNMMVPAAYVIPLDDNAQAVTIKNTYRQDLIEGFAVIVVVNNTADERGQAARNAVHDLKLELWKCLLGWDFDNDYEPIEYSGGQLIGMDRARLDFQFEFSAEFQINESLTRHGVDLANAPAFESMNIELDIQDLPPDGTVDHAIDITLEQ